MSEGPDEPIEASRLSPKQRRVLKWIAVAVFAPAAILFSMVAFFVARTEYMHDESRCPFQAVETRSLASGEEIVEERRTCQEGVEEHRWILVHTDGTTRELGRRRLMTPHFERYAWTARTEDGAVVVVVENEDVEDAVFREAPHVEKRQ